MRLADFLATNLEPILAEWEAFARTHVPVGEAMDVAGFATATEVFQITQTC